MNKIFKRNLKILSFGIFFMLIGALLFSPKSVNADVTSNYWIQNAPGSLSTNTPGGLATGDIHVAHCYIGTSSTTPCSAGGSGASLTANQTFTGQNTFSSTAPTQILNLETTLYADNFSGSDICAKADTAYASLGSNGGVIVIPSGSYTCATGLAQTVNGKKATFQGTGASGTRITYTGTGTALLINNAGSGSPQYSFYAARELTLIGTDNSSTSTQIGVYLGGANGAPGAIIDNVNVSGFGQDVVTGQNAYDITYENSILRNGYQNLYISTPNNSGESMRFLNMFIVDPAANRATDCVVSDSSGVASMMFNGGSFDSCQVHIKGGNFNVEFNGIHWENPGSTATGPYDYLVTDSSANTNVFVNGGIFYNGATTPNIPSEFMSINSKVTLNSVTFGSNSSTPNVPVAVTMTGTNAQLIWTGLNNTSGNAVANLATTSVNTQAVTPSGFLDYAGDASTVNSTAKNVASAFQIFNTSDHTTNTEAGTIDFSGNVFRVQSSNGGTGTLRDAIFGNTGRQLRVAATSSANGYYQMLAGTASGANTAGVGESYAFTPSSGINIGHSMALTANQTGTAGYTVLQLNSTETSVGSGIKKLIDGIVGGSSVFSVSNTGATSAPSFNGVALTTGGSATQYLNASGAYTTPAGSAYLAGTGLTLTGSTFSVNTSQNITTLSNLTSNGFVTTSGGTGALSVTTLGTGVATFLSTPTSANLAAALTDETGSGVSVFGTGPTITGATLTTSSVNGVTLTTGGGTTTFLNANGTYSTPAGGAVSSVSNADGTVTISPTTGAVVASLALGHANTWSALQTFGTNISIGGVTATGATGTGNVVFSNTPTLTTPVIGAATGTTLVLTNTSATGLAVGSTGATNPVLAVDSSVTSQTDGLTIQGKTVGNGVSITATSSGANAPIKISSIGTGTAALNANSGSGDVELQITGASKWTINSTGVAGIGRFLMTDQASSSQTGRFQFVGSTDINIPSGEASSAIFNINQTRTWASNTGFALERAFRIQQPTYAFTTATGTITTAATFSIDGAPVAGTNAVITNPFALQVTAGNTFLGGGIMQPTQTFTATTNTIANTSYTTRCDATTGNQTDTLPAVASSVGLVINFKKIDSSANTCTLKGSGAETIDGTNTKVESAQYTNIQVQDNGTTWDVL